MTTTQTKPALRSLATGEIVPAHRIGTTGDGAPLYASVAGFEPTVAYDLDTDGNWSQAICQCGAADGDFACSALLASDAVTIEYMPRQHRTSHEAAGNRGRFPHNGATRLRCTPKCATQIVEHADGWAEIVDA